MIPIVWGTKVKREQAGALATDCPVCLERTIADEFVVSAAKHVYFIHGGYKEATRYARCRLCGMAAPMPADVVPILETPGHLAIPDEEFIAKTNPSIAGKPKAEAYVKVEYPAGVTRLQAALFGAIVDCIKAQEQMDKVSGFTGGLALLLLPSSIFLSSYASDPVVALAACFILGTIGIVQIHLWMLHRAVSKEMQRFVRRVAEHTGLTLDNLIENATKLGKRYRKVSRHLQRMREVYSTMDVLE